MQGSRVRLESRMESQMEATTLGFKVQVQGSGLEASWKGRA